MPDEKISQLPAVTTVVAADLGVAVASNVTSKITQQNLINALVSFITENVNIGGGKIQLKTDGSGQFTNGLITWDGSGNFTLNSGQIVLHPNGSVILANGALVTNNVGVITRYNNIPTAGQGIATVVASVAIIIGSGSGPTTLITVPPSDGHTLYRISGYLVVETPDVSGTINVSATYDPGFGLGSQTIDLTGTQLLTAAAGFPCSGQAPGTNIFRADILTDITYTVTIIGDTGSSTSDLYLVLEQVM